MIGPHLKANLKGVHKLLRKDWDYPILVEGGERVGKSCLAIQMAKEIDPEFTVDQVVFDIPHLYTMTYSLPRYRAIVVDEAATSFFSRDAMKEENREGIRLITTMGHRNICLIICTTTVEIIDSYIRKHRMKAMVRVTKRGRYRFYGPRRTRQVRYDSKLKRWVYPSANFAESYSLPEPKLWSEYKKHKEEWLTLRADQYKGKDPDLVGISEACKIIGRSPATIYKWEDKKQIIPTIVNGRKKYRIGDLKRVAKSQVIGRKRNKSNTLSHTRGNSLKPMEKKEARDHISDTPSIDVVKEVQSSEA